MKSEIAFMAPAAPVLPSTPPVDDDDRMDLTAYLAILLDGRWTIGLAMVLAASLGIAYAMLCQPIYEANLLIQVEDSKGAASSALGEASSLFDVNTPAAGEIEIIRSRMVLGRAVENAKLFIDARPKYVPIVGRWLGEHSQALSEPGILGFDGYVYGAEQIVVPLVEITGDAKEEPLILEVKGDGEYSIEHEQLRGEITGSVGQVLKHSAEGFSLDLLVSKLEGKPGARFEIRRESRLSTIESLQERLKLTEKGRQSGVIEARLQDSDPKRLALVLNEIGRQYVRQNVERKAAEAQKTLSFLNDQLPQYKRQLEEAEGTYNLYRNSKGTVAFDEEAKLVLGQTVELQTKLLDARQRRRELESRFTNNHPTIQTLDAQIAAWAREIEGLNMRVKRMPQIQQDALRMERDVRVNAEMYQSLLDNSLQLNLVKEGKVGNVRLLDDAVVPEKPVKPRKSSIVSMFAIGGILFGIFLVLLRNALLRGIRDSHEIEARTGLNVYSTIPLSATQDTLEKRVEARKAGVHVLAASNPADPAVESLRSLRTALQFGMLEAPNNRIVITGATPGVGKSFISTNFAAVMASGGKRVLLIDADMRKGHINQHFGMKRELGLSELISGSASLDEVIRRDVLPGLDFISTGVLPPNPAELLMSSAFERSLNAASDLYDMVVVDTPPVLVAADTTAVAPLAGTVLLVARADKTYIGELQESTKRLVQAGKAVNGVLFNAMDVSARRYSRYGQRYGSYRYTTYAYQSQSAD